MNDPDHFVIWGSAGHAKVLTDMLRSAGKTVLALFDNNLQSTSCLPGVPLFYGDAGFSHWLEQFRHRQTLGAAVAIGGARGRDRHALGHQMLTAGLLLPSLVHPSAAVAASAQYGAGCHILAHAVLAADARLGEACIINNCANVDHECQLGDGVHIAPGAVLCGCVIVDEFAMVGAGAVILPRLHIGAGAVVGAGAIVTRDVPAGAIVVGNPARVLQYAITNPSTGENDD